MSAEQQRNLFQAFSQADTSITRKFGGTGLGLAISKHLTELMGGDIRVSSQPRVGSTFSFTINLRPGRQPAAVVHAASHRAPVVDDSPLAGLRVLLVDDLPTNCLIAGEILEAFGATVDTAENGVQALRKLLDDQIPCERGADGHPDAGNGWPERPQRLPRRAARRPAADHRHDGARPGQRRRERCRAAGMDDFIAKPINPEFLRRKLLPLAPGPRREGRQPNAGENLHVFQWRIAGTTGIDKADGLRRMMKTSQAHSTKRCCARLSHPLPRRDRSHPRRHRLRRPGHGGAPCPQRQGAGRHHRCRHAAAGGQGAGNGAARTRYRA